MGNPFAMFDGLAMRLGPIACLVVGFCLGGAFGAALTLGDEGNMVVFGIGIAGFILTGLLFGRAILGLIRQSFRDGDPMFMNRGRRAVFSSFWARPPLVLTWAMIGGVLLGALSLDALGFGTQP